MRNLKFLVLFLAVIVLAKPFGASACDVSPYAKSYIDQIHQVMGGEKPKLVLLKNSDEETVAYYTENTIYIYKNDYAGNCEAETPYLKSVIAHEYAHHLQKSLGKIVDLKDEDLAYVAEHAIADQILGGAEYDNDVEAEHLKQYEKIKEMIWEKQLKKLLGQFKWKISAKYNG